MPILLKDMKVGMHDKVAEQVVTLLSDILKY